MKKLPLPLETWPTLLVYRIYVEVAGKAVAVGFACFAIRKAVRA